MTTAAGPFTQSSGSPQVVSDGTSYSNTTDIAGSLFANVLTSNTITRPADTNAYTSGDLVADNVTAGSVTPFSFTSASSVAAGVLRIDRVRIHSSSTSLTNAQYRVHFYRAAPTGIANGDNGAWSTNIASYVGAFDVTVDRAFVDGSSGAGVPITGSGVLMRITAGTTLYALIEARAARTPISAETFSIIAEAYRF